MSVHGRLGMPDVSQPHSRAVAAIFVDGSIKEAFIVNFTDSIQLVCYPQRHIIPRRK